MSFKNITEIKRANKALGHHWFTHDPVSNYRVETKVLGGHYWVESANNFDQTARVFFAVAADPSGAVSYLHGAERFAFLDDARAIIDAIIDGRDA